MPTKRAIYAGSFDPLTNGHLWMIETAANLFDELIVAIGENPDKTYTFPLEERLEAIRQSIDPHKGISVTSFLNQYLVNFAAKRSAHIIVRGMRDLDDYKYETRMRHLNHEMNPDITTVILIPPHDIAEVSSSIVKGLIGPEGWRDAVARYVPPPVFQMILKKYKDA